MTEITGLFASFWQVFSELEVPLLGIKFSTLYLGIFAVTFSLIILRPILGLGNAFAHNRINLTSRVSRGSRNRGDKRAENNH